ncbi:MAG: response regulator, partial [Anaerolineae bacterium]|nr:response regulator [Anaerolineae bacterium]
MAFQVLLVQSNHEISKTLKQLFSNRGGEVLMAQDHETMLAALSQKNGYSPSLVILDLQMPKNGWLESFRHVSAKFPKAPVLFTTDRSNPDLISQAKAHGAVHFLRAPFTDDGLVHAMRRLSKGSASQASRPQEKRSAPKVRVPMQVKITFPYVFLALIISLTAAFVVSRVAQQSVEERFLSQIVDTGKISADWMVQEEARLLGTLRLVANTEGMAQSLTSNDAERLRALVLPIAINAREEIIEVLNADGLSVLTLQHIPGGNVEEYVSSRGEDAYLGWDFVQNILSGEVDPLGDKYSGIAHTTSGTYFYVGGALFDQDGTPVGIILVGKSALTLVRQIRESTLAHVTLYDVAGQDMASTLFSLEESAFPLPQDEVLNILQNKDGQSTMRSLSSEGTNYREILGVWESRGANDLGVLGVALPET